MFRTKDLVLVGVIFSSLFVGIMAPGFSSRFQPFPIYCMIILLLLSFLSVQVSAIWNILMSKPLAIALFLVIRMIVLPICVGLLFRLFWPEYSLSALLLSVISTGVVAPFMANFVQANSPLVLVVVVLSSLLVPFTLPSLVDLLFGRTMEISLTGMVKLLLLVVFVPFVLAEFLRRFSRGFHLVLLRRQYAISLVLFAVNNMGIFSAHSDFFRRQPMLILGAIGATLVLGAIYFVAGLLLSWGRPVEDQLAAVICLGLMNNVLVVVFSSQFFSPVEPMVAAFYMIPFFGLLLPLRAYRRYKEGGKPGGRKAGG